MRKIGIGVVTVIALLGGLSFMIATVSGPR